MALGRKKQRFKKLKIEVDSGLFEKLLELALKVDPLILTEDDLHLIMDSGEVVGKSVTGKIMDISDEQEQYFGALGAR
jgi:hypothetical protein